MPMDDHDSAATLGSAVRARRRRLRLTQQQVADLAGCSERSVRALEQGKPTLRLDVLLRVLSTVGLGVRLVPGHGEVGVGDDR